MKTIYTTLLALVLGFTSIGQGDFSWAVYDNYTPQHDNYIFAVATDAETHIISVGRSSKSSGTDNHLVVYKHDSDGNAVWEKTFNYSQYLADAQVTTDDASNIIISAAFRGDFTVGTETYNAANQQEDICLFKLNSDGDVQWSVHDGRTNGGEKPEAVCLDADGNIYYAGFHQAFKTYVGNDSLEGGGQTFIASYDSDGNFRWVKKCASGLKDLEAHGTSIYGYGNYGNGSIEMGDSTFTPTGGGIFVARFDQDGRLTAVVSEDQVVGKDLMVDGTRVYTTGFFTSAASVAGVTLNPVNNIDSYIAYYDMDLNGQSAFQVSSTGYTNGFQLAKSSMGNYVLMGSHDGDVNFAGATVTGSGFSHNVFILEFDSTDSEVQLYSIVGQAASTQTEVEEAGIAAGANNDFYLGGYLKGKGVFGTKEVEPGGNKYHTWVAQIGESGDIGTSAEEIVLQSEVKVFPNPFSHQVNIQLSNAPSGKLKLLDSSGRVVLYASLKSKTTLQVSHLHAGTYFMHIELPDGQQIHQPVMIL